jgi:hypothetical protein
LGYVQVAKLLYEIGQKARSGVCLVLLPDGRVGEVRIETYRGWVHAVDVAPARRFLGGKVPPRGEDALAALLRLEREHELRPRFDSELPLEKRGACTPFHPAALVRNAIDATKPDVTAFRRRIGTGTVSIPQPPHASCLGSDERPLVAYLKRPRTLEEIDGSDLCAPSRAGRLLAFLELVGALEVEAHPLESPYSLLGLPEGASADEVKRAFHRLARELHPDRHPGANEDDRRELAERFAAIHAAYRQILV